MKLESIIACFGQSPDRLIEAEHLIGKLGTPEFHDYEDGETSWRWADHDVSITAENGVMLAVYFYGPRYPLTFPVNISFDFDREGVRYKFGAPKDASS